MTVEQARWLTEVAFTAMEARLQDDPETMRSALFNVEKAIWRILDDAGKEPNPKE